MDKRKYLKDILWHGVMLNIIANGIEEKLSIMKYTDYYLYIYVENDPVHGLV